MKTTSTKRMAVPLIAAGLIVAGGVWYSQHNARAAAPKPAAAAIQVVTTTAAQQDVPVFLSGVGTVTAYASVTIKTRIDGQLDKLHFVEGQDVKAGQLLAEIDSRALRAQLAQMQATRARDAALLANARADLKRYTNLHADDATTQQTLDTQTALVAQNAATVQSDDAQIQYAQVQLDYTRITAPLSGRIGTRLVDAGNIVHASDTTGLLIINQIDPIAVTFTLPEEDVQRIGAATNGKQALAVTALSRDGKTRLAQGELVLMNNQVDTANGTVQLKGKFSNNNHALWPGQYVNVQLQLGTVAQAVTVPEAAIQRGQAGAYVYLIDANNAAAMQPVRLGQIQNGIAIIEQGLQAGQRVVVDGQYKLKPGAHVAEAAKPAAAAPRQGA
ncbi:efflux RND transporter periplasmic adaptor subunit [Pseudoduganella sp. FT26W]|uniref:Efflux RND transporter periplasmic adaptor subunit n=1 Tax=Duganella aquatilis TaxID=2666082 RepID=A0A844D5D3_9BURK|nr:efflux RND transporter periplasmic adaptor subunit [Duganella aquatilis]MRW83326.1 efflux RND transporter periplasmic adaptor subunit [Duganella aquatilis]